MTKPIHPQDLGIIDISYDDLVAYVNAMEEYRKPSAFIPRAYVSCIPVCPPAGYPAPMLSFNDGLSLRELPQQIRPLTLKHERRSATAAK